MAAQNHLDRAVKRRRGEFNRFWPRGAGLRRCVLKTAGFHKTPCQFWRLGDPVQSRLFGAREISPVISLVSRVGGILSEIHFSKYTKGWHSAGAMSALLIAKLPIFTDYYTKFLVIADFLSDA